MDNELWLSFINSMKAAAVADYLNSAKLGIELTIIGYAIIWTWRRMKSTQAERLVKGILVISAVYVICWVCKMNLILAILQHLLPVAAVSLVIIFQPEIRRGLGYLGRSAFKLDFTLADAQRQRSIQVIAHVITAVRELSKEKTGALLVIEPPQGERDYLTPGTTLNADVSSNLLLSIFVNKSPLHDGAAVIRLDKVVAAGVILPITENPKLSYRYGTRHRAAIGLSEIYDGLCIVVSEETGAISAANRGMLVKYETADDLADALSYFYHESPVEQKTRTPFQEFINLFGGNRRKLEFASGINLPPLHAPTQTSPAIPLDSHFALNAKTSQAQSVHTQTAAKVTSSPMESRIADDLSAKIAEPESTYTDDLRIS